MKTSHGSQYQASLLVPRQHTIRDRQAAMDRQHEAQRSEFLRRLGDIKKVVRVW